MAANTRKPGPRGASGPSGGPGKNRPGRRERRPGGGGLTALSGLLGRILGLRRSPLFLAGVFLAGAVALGIGLAVLYQSVAPLHPVPPKPAPVVQAPRPEPARPARPADTPPPVAEPEPVPGPPGPAEQPPVRPAEPAVPRTGRLAVVIDDLGEDLGFARRLAALDLPVSFSILPHRSHTQATARLAARAGRDVLLHLPMEPRGYPKQNPGPGALFTSMSPSRIRDLLDEDLDEVPEAVGVNNHMGSAFTESAPSLAPVLAVLRERGLFFLDSMTSPASRGDEMARAVGIPFIRRDVFLDNDRNVRAILAQLDKAERAAAKNGQAVAIGHPYPETLEALTRWSRRPGRVQVVPLTALSIRR